MALKESTVLANKTIKPRTIARKRTKPFDLRESDIEKYLAAMKKAGRTEGTLTKYRSDLNRFYDFLGESKVIYPDTLAHWKQSMLEVGYAPRTVNASVVAANGFLNFIGCRDWQLFDWMELDEADAPELTREDYQRLLHEAKRQENVQLYLIVKTLGCTDLVPSDLLLLTREAVNSGVVSGRMRGAQREVVLPELLREDLLDYSMQRRIKSGPIFLNRNHNPHNRSVIGKMINDLGDEAGLEPGKANARNLRRLYLNTLGEFQKKADDWVARSYIQLLHEEEAQVGWRVWLLEDEIPFLKTDFKRNEE